MIKTKTVSFIKSGYDPFIDFIKAYAIICVLIGHILPLHDFWGYGLWAGMQVPLFVLVQAFHYLKKDTPHIYLKKIFLRVVLPYILIQSIALLYLLSIDSTILYYYVISGGAGPGSYYPWIYIQIAFLLPIIKKWLDKNQKHKEKVLISFLVICELFEILFSIINLPDRLYRLLAIRYIFLLYFAWIWVKDGILINKRTTLLSVISFIAIIYFEYISVNDEVLFYNTAWKFHRWPCYYYVAVWGVYLLRVLYELLCDKTYIMKSIRLLARCSYEIFLTQMIVLYFYPSGYIKDMIIISGINNHIIIDLLQLIIKMMGVYIFSILMGYYFNLYYNRLICKYN